MDIQFSNIFETNMHYYNMRVKPCETIECKLNLFLNTRIQKIVLFHFKFCYDSILIYEFSVCLIITIYL